MKPNHDIEHLTLLSIFHYVAAGILALFSMFPSLYLAMGIAVVSGAFEEFDNGSPPPPIFGWMIIIVASMFIVCGLILAICVAVAGSRLSQQRSYVFCMVIAAIECIFVPLGGTVLGVFTIVVLMRPSVKTLFGVDQNF